MLRFSFLLLFVLLLTACTHGQDGVEPRLIGTCEGCEAVFEYGDRSLGPVDTLPGFASGQTRIKVTGTIFQPDGKTPAEGVILYVYHTDEQGLYSPGPNPEGWERRHGDDRGWIKTGADGRYTFYTFRPGVYPNRAEAAHIHPTILEPDGKHYWLGSYYFSDDPLLTDTHRNPRNPRGGSAGVMTLRREGDLWVGERDFVLGKHVSGYPRS
ncbi:MAG: intradiol ring-cleavage dioxygenase [Saprospiraceae bacterium]|nr:intradiol ring-cleavage dioxygenase [Saprospiraceae bacterium]